MTSPAPRRPGRPKVNPLPRAEQLRLAKRAQRERERRRGIARYPVKLPRAEAERLKAGMAQPGFVRRLREFVREHLIAVAEYENLAGLLWNRGGRFVTDEEAFRIYERNWRFVDAGRMQPAERALVDRLVHKYGNGVFLG